MVRAKRALRKDSETNCMGEEERRRLCPEKRHMFLECTPEPHILNFANVSHPSPSLSVALLLFSRPHDVLRHAQRKRFLCTEFEGFL